MRPEQTRRDGTSSALATSFGAVARDYDRLRSQPTAEVLDWLLPAGAGDALELGAGTGLLTALLVSRVTTVTAVEPDARMRGVLEGKEAGVTVVAGRAEEIPLPDASIDVVIAQSAWHWIDERRAVPEISRVLRPGGRFSLVWTGTDRSVAWMRTLWAGGVEHAPEEQAQQDARRRLRYQVYLDAGGRADFTEPETTRFTWTQPMTKADLVALAGTYSAVIAMDETERRRHLTDMARYLESLDQFSSHDTIDVPMRSHCWRTTRR